jgi:hypothetical protein
MKAKIELAWLTLPMAVAVTVGCTPAHIQLRDGATDAAPRDTDPGADGQADGGPGGAAPGTGGAADAGDRDGAAGGQGGGTGGQADAQPGSGGSPGEGGSGTGGAPGGQGGNQAGDGSVDPTDAPQSTDAAGDAPCGVGCVPSTFRVLRIGDGNTALSSAAAPVFIEQRRMDGTLLGTIALPTVVAGNMHPLTMSGSATSEGGLSLSADGRFLIVAGYSAPPTTLAIAASTAATVPRVVGRIDASGSVDTSTLLTAAFDGNNVRSAASADGAGFWAAGAGSNAGGVWFVPFGTTGGVRVLGTPNSVRVVNVFHGQLYASSNTGAFADVFTIGNGLPSAAGDTAAPLPGTTPTAAPSPFAFVFFDRSAAVAGVDTLYVADDRLPPAGGVQKWTFDGTVWTLVATFGVAQNPTGFRGLTGFLSPAGVTLIGSSAEPSLTRIVVFTDDGVNTPITTVVATAPPSTIMRGVALSPGDP